MCTQAPRTADRERKQHGPTLQGEEGPLVERMPARVCTARRAAEAIARCKSKEPELRNPLPLDSIGSAAVHRCACHWNMEHVEGARTGFLEIKS